MLMIDTHAFVKRLKAAGADEELAEVIASGISESGGAVATRADLDRFATREDLAELKAEMEKFIAGLIFAQSVVILGAVFAMIRFMS